ncbi:hypothetical protein [Marinobacterium iners]|uniref:Uncharacterized protein n=1 Tax=Marinobacterium iners DSM 11526 TaxID=1122198 RepID=A0A1H3X819_9GAMM|nr:hypothetical protein [Marinobacterium iners]SDZ95071.1 hypothetical protein SAMN02745729_10158 [Marinobacterium iners DSM 11526]
MERKKRGRGKQGPQMKGEAGNFVSRKNTGEVEYSPVFLGNSTRNSDSGKATPIANYSFHRNVLSSQPELAQMKQRIRKIETALDSVLKENKRLNMELEYREYLHRIGVSSDQVRGGTTIPVRIYLSDTKGKEKAEAALTRLFESSGIELVAEGDEVYGSWYKIAMARLRGFDVDQYEYLLHKAAEMKLVGKQQAEMDNINATTIKILKDSLAETSSGAAQAGAVLVVKFLDSSGHTQLVAKVLSPREMRHLEMNQQLLKQPTIILEKLSEVIAVEDKQIPPPQKGLPRSPAEKH